MQRILPRKSKQNDFNNKRWSTPFIESHDQQEQISDQSPYVTLLKNKLGMPREKAERACVATGFRSVEAATNWLLQRQDTNKPIRTEFILLLCPDERLSEQIRTFNSETFRHLSKINPIKDRQHLRAFKLSSFFHVPDRDVYKLHQVFNSILEQYHTQFKQILKVVLHMTSDYLMLIPDAESKKIFENIFDMFKRQLESIIPIIPPRKLAHLTLCHGLVNIYNLTIEQRTSLVQLARTCLDFDRPINWTLRLYSREQISINEIVYRVVSTIKEQTSNNYLSLKPNDLFMVLDNGRIGEQENVFGRSHTTGEEGQYPLKNLRKTSETDTWTLHKSASLIAENCLNESSNFPQINNVTSIDEKVSTNDSLLKKSTFIPRLTHTNGRIDPLSSTSNPGLIRLFCFRHGERIDLAFGPSWPELAFDKSGNYHRINLNMPMSLPHRRNPFRDFIGDSPITEMGTNQARLTGEALANTECYAQYCYSSPALRCIQTAHYILQGMGIEDRVKIRIEPGLFEFLGWYERGLPMFFNSSEMIFNEDEETNLFNIDKNYRPIIPLDKLSRDEKYTDFYNRSYKVTQQITDKHKLTGANIFFIGHAATLEVCTRQLCGLQPRSYSDFNSAIRKVSYLGLQLCERNPSDGQWALKPPPIPPLQHANNIAFDWQTMK